MKHYSRFILKSLCGFICMCSISFLAHSQKITCKPDVSIAFDYYNFLLKKMQFFNFTPTNVSRDLGYVSLALYETVACSTIEYKSLASQLTQLDSLPVLSKGKTYYPEVAVNSCFRVLIDSLLYKDLRFTADYYYPKIVRTPLDSLYSSYEHHLKKNYTNNENYRYSQKFGIQMALSIFKYSMSDGGAYKSIQNFINEGSHYKSPAGSTWQDSLTKHGISSQPSWGKNRTFVPAISMHAKAAKQIPFSTNPQSEFYQQAYEIYLFWVNETFQMRLIAEYWKDNPVESFTPPGHSTSILLQILKEKNASLDYAAYALAKMGLALNDAFICCWKTKYETNSIRPEQYIQKYIDPRFRPAIPTPQFPEYTSGHSVQAGAAAEVLTDLFGDDYKFTDKTLDYSASNQNHKGLLNRSFNSFYEFATEASMSRMYGGIHFRQACEAGLVQGKQVGKFVNGLEWKNSKTTAIK